MKMLGKGEGKPVLGEERESRSRVRAPADQRYQKLKPKEGRGGKELVSKAEERTGREQKVDFCEKKKN